MQTFLYTLHFIVCFVLIGVVLLQRGKGADLGASLGGGGANTIFGSRGAGNFLSKITTASAVIFMGTSLSLSYLGYQASDVQLFDESQPFDVPGVTPALPDAGSGALEEIPGAAADSVDSAGGALVEVSDPISEAADAAAATIQEGLQEVEKATE
jgi:preprotein translocase subunit SecG